MAQNSAGATAPAPLMVPSAETVSLSARTSDGKDGPQLLSFDLPLGQGVTDQKLNIKVYTLMQPHSDNIADYETAS